MAEFARGGYLPRRDGDEDLIPAGHNWGYMLSAAEVRALGGEPLKRLMERLNIPLDPEKTALSASRSDERDLPGIAGPPDA